MMNLSVDAEVLRLNVVQIFCEKLRDHVVDGLLHAREGIHTNRSGKRREAKALEIRGGCSHHGRRLRAARRVRGNGVSLQQSLSTVSCVAVIACTVVNKPSTITNFTYTTFVSGAQQFVVHEAFDTTVSIVL
jgi:hypothetical protein